MQSTVLITGATSGIGYSFARICCRKGYDLVIVSRSTSKLKETQRQLQTMNPKISVDYVTADLSQPKSVDKIMTFLSKKKIAVDILINNAGVGIHTDFLKTETKQLQSMLSLNMVVPTLLMKTFGKMMEERGNGKILNVSSTAAFQPGPHMAAYFATKAYLLSLSQGVSYELKTRGVTVSTLCPGATRTSFTKQNDLSDTVFFKTTSMDPDKVARIGFDGLLKGKELIIPGFHNKMGYFFARALPWKMVRSVTAKLFS